ncbi:pYEATS domain-containing protein [Promicromonospora sp. NPDC057488]|uniref:pYEATS domain-containing protein n=1 Tax=Promicromonospora sp. NPDC057488 TaxID=3346147 RepID=UPI00366C81E0
MRAYLATVPLLETLAWIGLILIVLVCGRKQWVSIVEAIRSRVQRGDGIKISIPGLLSAELSRSAIGLVSVAPDSDSKSADPSGVGTLEDRRTTLGRTQRGVHIVHIAAPSMSRDGWYDVLVYLSGYNRSSFGVPDDLSDIKAATFQMGPKFSPSTAKILNRGKKRIGFKTSAYGPFLCVCRVKFVDKTEVTISRYIDFEAARLTERLS